MPPVRHFLSEHRRWLIVGLLFFISAVNYLDRQALSILVPTLRVELKFGPIEYSYVVTAFLVAYTLGYAFCARILDRWGVKVGLAVALGCWSLTAMLHGAVTGWKSLAMVRFLLGLSESFNNPGGVKAITEWIPVRERGTCVAIFLNGNVLGIMLAPPLVSLLALNLGWRWAFIITGALGLLLLLIWLREYHSPEKHPRLLPPERKFILGLRPAESRVQSKKTMIELLTNPICLSFFLARFLIDSISYFFAFWMPSYFMHSRGVTLALVGMVGWVPYIVQVAGSLGGGALSDWLIRRGWGSANSRQALIFSASCLMPLANIAVRTDSVWLAFGLVAVMLAANGCYMVNLISLISETVSAENVTTLLALSALGGSLGGVVSTLLVGRAINDYGYVPIFTVLSALPIVAFAMISLGRLMQARENNV